MGIKEIKEKMTENEKIELFDKWYDENYDEWAEGEEGIALREELEQAFKSGIATLEKENAELKHIIATLRQEKDNVSMHAKAMEVVAKTRSDQLTKAKELLERLLITSCNSDVLNLLPNCSEVLRVRVEAEQFIKDSEVEK